MARYNPVSLFLHILITIIFPPLGVVIISGLSADLAVNICLTILGYIPGHVHGLYLLYVLVHKREVGPTTEGQAPGVFSDNIQRGQPTYGSV